MAAAYGNVREPFLSVSQLLSTHRAASIYNTEVTTFNIVCENLRNNRKASEAVKPSDSIGCFRANPQFDFLICTEGFDLTEACSHLIIHSKLHAALKSNSELKWGN